VIAIIGVNSLSGSTFAKHALERGHEVIGFGRQENPVPNFTAHLNLDRENLEQFTFLKTNILQDYDVIAREIAARKCDIVINFAAQSMVAQSWNSPEDWYEVNVSAFSKLVSCIRKRNGVYLRKFVNFSTPEVYGSRDGLIMENWNFNPTTPYAISRAASDFHLRALASNFDFPVIFTRTANVYGPHQKLYRVVPKLITQAIKKEKFQLHGGGTSLRSFIHIDDVTNALFMIAEKGEIGNTYHISTNEFISIADLTRLILDRIGREYDECVEVVEDRQGKDSAYLLNSEKIRSELDWNDSIPLKDGLDTVINWIKQDWNTLKDINLDYVHSR